jgi:hypothetical protein
MTRNILTILITVACLMWALSSTQSPAAFNFQDTSQTQPPRLTFSALKRNDSIKGEFIVVAFVIQTYKCPPCPPNAMCKACLGDHIVVTEKVDEKDATRIQRLRIFTDKPEQFELKKKYSFTVRTRGKTAPGHPLEEVDLISFKPVKE